MLTATSISTGVHGPSEKTVTYIYTVIGLGAAVFLEGILRWSCPDWRQFSIYLAVAMIASAVHLSSAKLIGATRSGTFSLAFVIVLASLFDLTYSESLILAAASCAVQCLRKVSLKTYATEVSFNLAVVMVSMAACRVVVQTHLLTQPRADLAVRFGLVTCLFFALNTALVSGVIAVANGKPVRGISKFWFTSYFPIYLVGAGLAGLFVASGRLI